MRTLRAGDWVEVRSKEEILATLGADGLLDRMPFMPEMLAYCGQRFRVSAVAHKTCDTVTKTGGRRVNSAVHLEDLRYNGRAHGGCQAECRIYWKEAWLRPVDVDRVRPAAAAPSLASGRTEAELHEAVYAEGSAGDSDPVYVCQATRLPQYTSPLFWRDARQYVNDVTTRNHPPARVLRVLFLAGVEKLQHLPFGYRVFKTTYDALHRLLTGRQSPYVAGTIKKGESTPHGTLDLEPGDRVRVKSLESIARTLNADNNKNRGLSFDPEMAPYSGHTFRVRQRVVQIIDERTGKMIRMKNPCITLEGAVCGAEYSACRLLCPRGITSYWRELWLERCSPAFAMNEASDPHGGEPSGVRAVVPSKPREAP